MKKVIFKRIKSNPYHIYKFINSKRFLSDWKGFNSSKWHNEYYPRLVECTDFFVMPFTGAELVLYPSIVLNLMGYDNLYCTVLYDSYEVQAYFDPEKVIHSRWHAQLIGSEILFEERSNYIFEIGSYKDIVNLQDCSDESLELVFFKLKDGMKSKFIHLLNNKANPQHEQSFKNCFKQIIFSTNGFDLGCDDLIQIMSFSNIDKEIDELENNVKKAIGKYETLVSKATNVELYIQAVNSLLVLSESKKLLTERVKSLD